MKLFGLVLSFLMAVTQMPLVASAEVNSGYIFWGSHAQHTLKRSNLSGGDVTVLHQLSYTPLDMSVDRLHEQVYWVDGISSAIYSTDYDGSQLRSNLALSLPPTSVAVDPTTQLLFWIDQSLECGIEAPGDPFPGKPVPDWTGSCERRVWSHDPAKPKPTRVFGELMTTELPNALLDDYHRNSPGTQQNIVAYDALHQFVYWAEENRIRRAHLDGTSAEIIYSANAIITSLALDSSLDRLCWTSGDVACARLDGTNVREIDTASGPRSIRLKYDTAEVYWLEKGANGYPYLTKAGIDSGETQVVYDFQSAGAPFNQVADFVIDVDGGHLFIIALDDTQIVRSDLDCSNFVDLNIITNGIARPKEMWSFGNNLYWREDFVGQLEYRHERVMSIPMAGGSVTKLFDIPTGETRTSHTFYVGSENYVVWIEPNRIRRSLLDGSSAETLISEPTAFRILSSKVCFLYPEGISCMNRDGSNIQNIVIAETVAGQIVVDESANYLFWIDATTHNVMRADLSGNNAITFLDYNRNQVCSEIAGDTVHHNLYCIDDDSVYLTAMASSASFVRLFVIDQSSDTTLSSLAVDPTGDALYVLSGAIWSRYLYQAHLDGSSLSRVTDVNGPRSLILAKGGALYYNNFQDKGVLTQRRADSPLQKREFASTNGLDGGASWVRNLMLDLDPITGNLVWNNPEDGKYYTQSIDNMFTFLAAGAVDINWDPERELFSFAYPDGVAVLPLGGVEGPVIYNQLINQSVSRLQSNPNSGELYLLAGNIFSFNTGNNTGALLETNLGSAMLANLAYRSDNNTVIWTDGYNDPAMQGDPYVGNAPHGAVPDPDPYVPGAIYSSVLGTGTVATSVLINPSLAEIPLGIAVATRDALPPSYSIGGLVTVLGVPFDGQPVVGGATLGISTTIANGTYAFSAIPGGTQANLSVAAPGYTFVEGTSQPLSFVVTSNVTRNFVGTPNRITGHARFARAGTPAAPGVLVSNGYNIETTDDAGYYEFTAVPNGTYTIAGFLENYRVEIASGTGEILVNDNSQVVDLLVYTDDNPPPPPVDLFSVTGYVHLSGSPLPQQSVDGGSILGRSATNAQGEFIFSGLTAGTLVDLSVIREGYHFVEATNQPTQFVLTENAVRNFEGEPNRIFGHVRFANFEEEPAGGVTVSAGSMSASSNSLGEYQLVAVPNGTYTVTGVFGNYLVEVERGVNPVTIENGSEEVNLWVYPEKSLVVYAPWNGFLDVTSIVETINTGLEDLAVTITLYGMDGNKVAQAPRPIRANLNPGEQRDFIINDIPGFEEDRYGIVKVEFSNPFYNGRVTYYKPAEGETISWQTSVGEQFDYVFVNPFVNPVKGPSFVSFNTFQPSKEPTEANHLIPNWLTIINAHPTDTKYFRVRKYDQDGNWLEVTETVGTVRQNCQVTEGDLRCKVQPMGRIDVDGGHVTPGPDSVGLIELTPEDSTTPYSANLIRYGMKSTPEVWTSDYAFGNYFQTRDGSTKTQVMAVSSPERGDNWIEVANVEESSIEASVKLYGFDGAELGSWPTTLKPRQTKHFLMSDHLLPNQSATVKVRSLAGKLIAQSVLYYRNKSGSITAALSSQSREQYSKLIYGTYNSFLGVYQWLKVVNLDSIERQINLRLDSGQSFLLTLEPFGGLDVPLHDPMFGIGAETIGSFELEDTNPGRIFATLVRVKNGSGGDLDYVIATDVE